MYSIHLVIDSTSCYICALSYANFVGFIQIAITTIANLSSCAEDNGKFFDVDQVHMC